MKYIKQLWDKLEWPVNIAGVVLYYKFGFLLGFLPFLIVICSLTYVINYHYYNQLKGGDAP